VKTVKELCLSVAVVGVVAGTGSALGCAVAAADTADAAAASDSAASSDSARAPASRAATTAVDRGPGRTEAPTRANRTESARVGAERDDSARPSARPADTDDGPAGTPAPSVAAPEIDEAPTVPAEPATTTPAATPTDVAAPVAPAVPLVAATPAAMAVPVPAPAAPLVRVVPLPLLPTTPVAPPAPAGVVSVSASATTTRNRSAGAVAAQITDPPQPNHVLLIGTDGTNLSKILEYGSEPGSGFRIVMENGVTAASSIVGHTTLSGPSWSTILTGAWDDKTGVINNLFTPAPYDAWPTVFNLIEYNQPDVETAVFANWRYINDVGDAGGYPADENVFVPFRDSWADTDDDVAAETIERILATGVDDSTFIFSYQVGVDEVGHEYGGSSPEYAAALLNTSENIAAIMAAIDLWETANPGQRWTVIVTTDHGHQQSVGFGHGFQSPNETSVFVMFDLEGDDANDGRQNLAYSTADITPTIVSLFGIDQRSDFDGVPMQDKANSTVDPGGFDNLKQTLGDAVASYGYPNIGTDIALGARTVFGAIPYFLTIFLEDITAQLQSVVDDDIFLLSALAGVTEFVVGAIGNALVGVTQAIAQAVGWLTGAGRIAPTDPPLPPPPAGAIWLPEHAALLV
jgi:hypothetical protein